MADIAAVHQVLTMCGITIAATRNIIIDVEGFNSLSALGMCYPGNHGYQAHSGPGLVDS